MIFSGSAGTSFEAKIQNTCVPMELLQQANTRELAVQIDEENMDEPKDIIDLQK